MKSLLISLALSALDVGSLSRHCTVIVICTTLLEW